MMEDLPMVLLANVALIHTNLIKNTKEHETTIPTYSPRTSSL